MGHLSPHASNDSSVGTDRRWWSLVGLCLVTALVWVTASDISIALPTIAKMAKVRASFGANPTAVNDQKDPAKSIDHNHPFYHFWPHKGTAEWLEYTLPKAIELGPLMPLATSMVLPFIAVSTSLGR